MFILIDYKYAMVKSKYEFSFGPVESDPFLKEASYGNGKILNDNKSLSKRASIQSTVNA